MRLFLLFSLNHRGKPQTEVNVMRPADLAREHGLSTQAVRNYERDGFLPPAERTAGGYRIYTERHAAALRAYLALVAAYGHATGGVIMASVNADWLDGALTAVDRGHAQLLRDRETLATVRRAVDHLTAQPAPEDRPAVPGPLTHRRTRPPARPHPRHPAHLGGGRHPHPHP
ncbi:MerR family DNA-binding transcriptional regulator [Kitasatospora sp. NPDC001539]|uniref:MerR family DNA-binding transcriptional regulator n=1 Tax=Kitasatospora sp. NPDC001539 TaxID=3154384 RepID=UPI003323755C